MSGEHIAMSMAALSLHAWPSSGDALNHWFPEETGSGPICECGHIVMGLLAQFLFPIFGV